MRLIALTVAAGLAAAAPARAIDVPLPEAPSGRVNDLAGALAADARTRLETQLAGYERGTSRQIAVAVLRSLDGAPIEDVSMRLAERWKIGGKSSSDGVLLVVALAEHRARIEVGYGLEPQLTDLRSAQILREVIAPRMRAGDLEGALREGCASIAAATGGVGQGVAPTRPDATGVAPSPLVFVGGLLLVLFVIRILRRRGGGGFFGGGLGGFFLGGGGGRGGDNGGGGGFSGGGGSFGGGGASGDW